MTNPLTSVKLLDPEEQEFSQDKSVLQTEISVSVNDHLDNSLFAQDLHLTPRCATFAVDQLD